MKVIARPMGTGKTEELLRTAAENKALVLADNKEELINKANAYGITVQIVDLDDMYHNDYEGELYIYKMDEFMKKLIFDTFNMNLAGFTIRLEG